MLTDLSDVNDYTLAQEMKEIAQRLKLQTADEALYFPKYFQVETTRLCNARCPFCAIDQWDQSVPLMSDTLYEKIVEEMSHYADWIEFVAVQRAGEPLMDRKIAQRVHLLKQAKIKWVSLSTNAALLNEKRAVSLLEAGLDELMISIDSIDREPYESMRVGCNYDKVFKNVDTFFRLRDEYNPRLIVRVRGVSFYDLDQNEQRQELERWEQFWNRYRKPHDRIYMKRAHTWGNQKEINGLPDQDWVYHPCVLPWSTLHITSMGKVPLCPHDYDANMNLGDIHHQSIAEVWRGETWSRIRRLHQTGKRNEIPYCQGCRLFDKEFSLEKEPATNVS